MKWVNLSKLFPIVHDWVYKFYEKIYSKVSVNYLIIGWEDPLEKGKATHSNILAWTIPWTV